jgi:hypothetical protein
MATPASGAPQVSRATNFDAPDLSKKTKGAYNEFYAESPALVTFASGDVGIVTGVCGSPKRVRTGVFAKVAAKSRFLCVISSSPALVIKRNHNYTSPSGMAC